MGPHELAPHAVVRVDAEVAGTAGDAGEGLRPQTSEVRDEPVGIHAEGMQPPQPRGRAGESGRHLPAQPQVTPGLRQDPRHVAEAHAVEVLVETLVGCRTVDVRGGVDGQVAGAVEEELRLEQAALLRAAHHHHHLDVAARAWLVLDAPADDLAQPPQPLLAAVQVEQTLDGLGEVARVVLVDLASDQQPAEFLPAPGEGAGDALAERVVGRDQRGAAGTVEPGALGGILRLALGRERELVEGRAQQRVARLRFGSGARGLRVGTEGERRCRGRGGRAVGGDGLERGGLARCGARPAVTGGGVIGRRRRFRVVQRQHRDRQVRLGGERGHLALLQRADHELGAVGHRLVVERDDVGAGAVHDGDDRPLGVGRVLQPGRHEAVADDLPGAGETA